MSQIINGATSLVSDNTPRIAGSLKQAVFTAHYYKFAPALGAATTIHAAIAQTTAAQVITTGITQPDFPRLLSVKGNAAGNSGDVVITGKDVTGAVITDTIAITDATVVAGTKAFASVTSISVPVQVHAGTDTVAIGVSATVFGLPISSARKAFLYRMMFNGSTEAGTFTNSTSAVCLNTYTTAGTADSTKSIELIWFD